LKKQLNIRVPEELYLEVKRAALTSKVYKEAGKALTFWLWLTKNLGVKETAEVVEATRPLALLMAARNDLSHEGYPTDKLDAVIEDVKGFIEGSQKVEVKRG
jgi:hypothetical protein